MWERYRETFDGIHASQRLKTEVMNMKREESVKKRRRIPAAALVAAILAAALAGTAVARELAEGYFGRLEIDMIDSYEFEQPEDGTAGGEAGQHGGYEIHLPEARIPVDSLSAEVLEACLAEPEKEGEMDRAFDSWSAAEAFLGLELADNSRLEQMPRRGYSSNDEDGHCDVSVLYSEHLPGAIWVKALYEEANCFVLTQAALATEAVPDWCRDIGGGALFRGEDAAFQAYVTPGGEEVLVCSESTSQGQITYYAHFIMNDAIFTVMLTSDEDWRIGREDQVFLDPWEILTEILDAYE